jgi:FAD dependent oxidoreductase TIGR03364
MRPDYDDIVIGAGIVGLAHAYHLARRGRRVAVLERLPRACGASVRNFGMLWPIGPPAGVMLQTALRSIDIWREVLRDSGLWHENTGSLHVAHRTDEMAVLDEFAARAADLGYDCRLLTPAEVSERAPAVNLRGLQGGLWSGSEWCVDPREIIRRLPDILSNRYGVSLHFRCAATALAGTAVVAAGREWRAGHFWLCTGDDLETLLPELLSQSGLERCKLQMMRSKPSSAGWRLGPMLAGGLTLRHYKSFERCSSVAALKARVASEMAEYDRFGIHVMASQTKRGDVTIGDSHVYGDEVTPFDDPRIDRMILDYLSTLLAGPEPVVSERWHGTYCKHPSRPYFAARPEPHVSVITGLGGAGMTLSFGVAEQIVGRQLDGLDSALDCA